MLKPPKIVPTRPPIKNIISVDELIEKENPRVKYAIGSPKYVNLGNTKTAKRR